MKDPPGQRQFATTHWSLVGAAKPGEVSQSRAREALEELCRTYWYPLYAFVRSLEAYRKAIGERTTLVLSPDSEFFQFLQGTAPKQ